MAVAYASHDKATTTSGDLVITKPSGLAAGDLMIAIIATHDSAEGTASTGFTQERLIADATNYSVTVLFKVANSGDAAASNFTFTNPGNEKAGVLIRVTGTAFSGTANIENDAVQVDSDTTPTYTGGVTTRANNDLLIFAIANTSIATHSGYSVANNNPSWTERDDFQLNDSEDWTLSFATATYATTGATGDYSASVTVAGSTFGMLMSITENLNASVTPDPAVVSAVVVTPDVTGGANVSAGVIAVSAVTNSPTVATPAATVVNVSKNAASPTNVSKNNV